MGVSKEEREAVGEALLDLCLGGVIVRGAGVVSVGRYVEEARVGLEKLRLSDCFSTD